MKSNELRIGNIIRVTFSKEESGFGKDYNGLVESIQKSKLLIKGDVHWQPLDSMEPIPLTPDILEKCGFVLKDNTFYTKDNIISLAVFDGKLSTTYVCGDNQVNQVKYLHQLQNLYFCLAGEELEVKL